MGWFDDNAHPEDIANGQMPAGGNTGVAGPSAPVDAPAAFDPSAVVGHNGTTSNGMNREAYRDAWFSSGAKSMGDLQKFIQANGGTLVSGNGTVRTPFGEEIDMGANARGSAAGQGQMSASWGGVGGDAGGAPQAFRGPTLDGPSMGGYFGGGGGYGGPGGGGGGGFTGMSGGWDGQKFTAANPYQANPITGRADFNPATLQGRDVSVPGAYQGQQFAGPEAFKAPTAADLEQDPSYQFRFNQGQKALENSKAATGLLRSGATAKALQDYGQQSASQEYANVYNRKFGENQNAFSQAFGSNQLNNQTNANAYDLTNRYKQGAELANQQNAFNVGQANISNAANAHQMNASNDFAVQQANEGNRFNASNANNANALAAWQANTNAQLGQGNLALGYTNAANTRDLGFGNIGLGYHQADQSYDLGLKNNALGYTQAANSYSLGNASNQLGWANYGLNQQGQDWNQAFSLANLGFNAAQQSGQWGGQYGQNAGGFYTSAGNADAAGKVGAGNAWNQAFGNIGNGAMNAAGTYYGNKNTGVYAQS